MAVVVARGGEGRRGGPFIARVGRWSSAEVGGRLSEVCGRD